jgi:hypothetical protein
MTAVARRRVEQRAMIFVFIVGFCLFVVFFVCFELSVHECDERTFPCRTMLLHVLPDPGLAVNAHWPRGTPCRAKIEEEHEEEKEVYRGGSEALLPVFPRWAVQPLPGLSGTGIEPIMTGRFSV